MTFEITVYGADEGELTDVDKEDLADRVHRVLQEDHGVNPDSVGVEGYMEE